VSRSLLRSSESVKGAVRAAEPRRSRGKTAQAIKPLFDMDGTSEVWTARTDATLTQQWRNNGATMALAADPPGTGLCGDLAFSQPAQRNFRLLRHMQAAGAMHLAAISHRVMARPVFAVVQKIPLRRWHFPSPCILRWLPGQWRGLEVGLPIL
jgi:hypothetical protein